MTLAGVTSMEFPDDFSIFQVFDFSEQTFWMPKKCFRSYSSPWVDDTVDARRSVQHCFCVKLPALSIVPNDE